MTNYKKGILDLFDESTSDALQSFCKRINTSEADVFIIMAHKAICLFKVLQDQNYINIGNKPVISNLSLDFETESLNDKKIAVVDDIMISGTAVSSAVNKAISCGANKNDISVIVLAIDTDYMRMQFINESHKNVLECNTYLSDNECIKLSSNLSNAFSYYGIPYDYDFPIYEGIRIDNDEHNALFNNFFWDCFDISNDYQKEGDINSYLIIPKKVFLNDFYKSIGVNFINSVNFKIKIYLKNYTNKELECIVTPLCLFNEVKKSDIETLFEHINTNPEKKDYSIEAKTRYVQYYLSHRLFSHFNNIISLTHNDDIIPNDIRTLFGNNIYSNFLDNPKIYNESEIVIKSENIDFKIYNDFIEASKNQKVLNTIPSLLKPFIWWYDNKEIPVRNYLKKNPVNFLDDYKVIIKNKMPRLTSGFSFNTLMKILNILSEDDKNALSIFIDRSIDLGILVPTIYYNKENKTICRAYRHGEDLPFALADQIRLLVFLLVLEEKIKNINSSWDRDKNDEGIASVSFEKMIVSFYQIGLKQGGIFNRFLGFDNIDIMKPFLSVHGKVNAIVNPKEINKKRIKEHYYSEKVKIKNENEYIEYEYIKWLSVWLEENNFIYKTAKNDKARIFIDKDRIKQYIEKENRDNIDKKIHKKIKNIGITISQWYNYTLSNGGKDRFKKDATALTSCENITVFSSAIATEIHYFKNYWDTQAKEAFTLEDFSGNNFVWSVTEQALNSGRDKKIWYEKERAKEVVDTISNKIFKDSPYDWDNFWHIENKPYPEDSVITEKLYEAIGYLYFYSACYDCLKSNEFWEENILPDTLEEYETEFKKQCKKAESLEDNLFDIFRVVLEINNTNQKKNKMKEEISKVIPCSEKTVDEIEECIQSSKNYYTVKYRSSLIFEVNPICEKKCDEHIMNIWNNLQEDDNKTQLNIIRFNDDCENDKYIRYGLFYGFIKDDSYSIDYSAEVLINCFKNLCKEFNCKAHSIRAILIPHIPSNLTFKHNTYKNINTYSKKFYKEVVSVLENMFIKNKYHQLVLITTRYTPENTKKSVEQLGWDTIEDIGSQSFPLFTGNTCVTKYSNEPLELNGGNMARVNSSIVKIECGNSIGAGLLVKTNSQVVCITCNHIVADYENNTITATLIVSNNVKFDLTPIKQIMSNIDNPLAKDDLAILEPTWNGIIPINTEQLVSFNDFCNTIEGTCVCCGFPNEMRWESGINISRPLDNGYIQLDSVDNIEAGFSGGTIIDKNNKIVGIHEGRFNSERNGKMIPISLIKKEIYEILGDCNQNEK